MPMTDLDASLTVSPSLFNTTACAEKRSVPGGGSRGQGKAGKPEDSWRQAKGRPVLFSEPRAQRVFERSKRRGAYSARRLAARAARKERAGRASASPLRTESERRRPHRR